MTMGMRRRGVLAVCALALLAACGGGGDDPPPPPPTTGALTVANHHCIPIEALYVRPASTADWGPNQLAVVVAPGASFTVGQLPPGTYDVWAEAGDGVYWDDYGIAIPAGTMYPFPLNMPAGTGCVKVVNSSGYDIGPLYAAATPDGCTYGTWGNDQLGGGFLARGQSFMLSIMAAGDYDLWAYDTSGTVSWDNCDPAPPVTVAAGQITTWTIAN